MRIIRRGSGSVVTCRRAQMVLLSAQGMEVAAIAKVAFTSKDRVPVPGVLPLPALPLPPTPARIAIICDNFSPHLSTAKDGRVGAWAKANNVEIACTPTNSSWLNRIEAQFTALRYSALDGTDHASHKEQANMIRRYIIWRNNHAYDERLRRIVNRANVA